MSAALRRSVASISLVTALLAAALFAGTASAGTGCGTRATTKPFASVGDGNAYFLPGGGDVESSLSGWTLSGGAKVVSGNQTKAKKNGADSKSLLIPAGGSVTTGWICVTKDDPSLRFFLKTSSLTGNYSNLITTAVIKGPSGSVITHYFGSLSASSTYASWTASPVYSYAIWLSNSWLYGSGDTVQVQFTFNTQGSGGSWQVDDVYVDPFKGT